MRLPGFRDPGEARLCQRLYLRIDATSSEGQRILKESYVAERNQTLAREAKELNRSRNNAVIVCEGCDLADVDAALFDAHHLNPVAAGERQTHIEDLRLSALRAIDGPIVKVLTNCGR